MRDPVMPAVSFWWSEPLSEIFRRLDTTPRGITQSEAGIRLKRYGPNVFARGKKQTILGRFFAKLTHPLILLLLVAAVIAGALGQISDCIIITVILLISITLDVYQEHRADESAQKLRHRVSLTATVLRDGVKNEVPLSHVVPGDVVVLSVGDIIPADCRLLTAQDLLVDQSSLTGESFPQQKNVQKTPTSEAPVIDRANCVFMGTHVLGGEGTAIVIQTGSETEFGHVASSLVVPRPQTAFEKGINSFGILLTKTAIVVCFFVLISHVFIRHDFLNSLLFVLALAIGFAPELLPVILTINLSKGALRMSKGGVIVKSLQSIENFGSIEILATDKTGTLTENTISVSDYVNISNDRDERILLFGYLNSFYQSGYKGPLEKALLGYKPLETGDYRYVSTLPFDFFRKRVSVVVRHEDKNFLIIKGAPEEIMRLSRWYSEKGKRAILTHELLEKATERFRSLSQHGLRSLAVAYREIGSERTINPKDERDLTFLGFITFTDPPKKTASSAVMLLAKSGIEIKVLTGDNELVTQNVCASLHIPVRGILTSEELARLRDRELEKKVIETTIFARLNPDQKQRILMALRKAGKVVGYLGDGINDAPSFRAADIGISVNNAADVAKESADIILLHKDLHVLREGIVEGRRTFGNVMKYLNMGMSSNFGNMVSIALSSLFLPFLPLLPTQVLLNDLFYDVSQLLLTNDSVDSETLDRPQKWNITSIKKFMLIFGPVSSLFDFVTFAFLLWYFKANAQIFQTGWFLESIATQTLIVFSIRTHLVPFVRSKPNPIFSAGLVAIVAISLILPFTPLGSVFSFVKPPLTYYALLVGIVILYVALVEVLKVVFYAERDNERSS